MRIPLFLSSTLLFTTLSGGAIAQNALPPYEEHLLEKTDEPCVTTEYEGEEEERCTTLNLSWITFENLPVLNDSIVAHVKGMLVDFEQPDTTGTLDELVEDWFSRLQEEAAQDTLTPPYVWIWDFQQNISVHDRRGNLLTLGTGSYVYTGGAHGLPYTGYLHWDIGNDHEMVLDNLLVDGQVEAFWSLAREAHRRWAKENNFNQDYLDGWPFMPTEEFYYGDDGLTLVYNVYEIAPYVMGPQELVVPWEQLERVVKPDYLTLVR